MDHLVSASLLSADLGNLEKAVGMVNESSADWVHIDVMDGVFVPNITFGLPVTEYVRKVSKKPLDVHLMIIEPDRYLSRFRDAGADILTVQYETCVHLNRTVTEIRNLGMKAGVALNPHTPVINLKHVLPYTDMVLIMTVNPGFGGQTFITESYDKIRELREMIDSHGTGTLIQVDGGVDTRNAAKLVNEGVDVLVAGNAIFNSQDPARTIRRLKELD